MKKKEIKITTMILILSLSLTLISCEKIKKAIIDEFNSERAEKKTESCSKELK